MIYICCMKDLITDARREFTARYLADISKAIFAVALASKFFIDMAVWLRISLPVAGIMFFTTAFFMQPHGGKK